MLMNKKYLKLLVVALFAATFFACHSSKHTKTKRLPGGVWQEKPITIDGLNNDWPAPYPEYDDKAMLGYAVSNDRDNLYITVETGDEATQMKILREGLTVWIDKEGEQNELVAINYPLPTDSKGDAENRKKPGGGRFQQGPSGEAGGDQEQKKRMELEEKVRRLLPEAREYSLQGFKACNLQFPLMENDTCGIKVRMDIDSDNEMVWEAVIPFKAFYYKAQITRADKGKPLSICFETTGMKKPAGQGSGSGNGGGGGPRPSFSMGGFGGMRMGAGGGGRGGNHSGQTTPNIMDPAYKSTKTWKTFGIGFPNQ